MYPGTYYKGGIHDYYSVLLFLFYCCCFLVCLLKHSGGRHDSSVLRPSFGSTGMPAFVLGVPGLPDQLSWGRCACFPWSRVPPPASAAGAVDEPGLSWQVAGTKDNYFVRV